MKTNKNFLKKLTAGLLGFVMTLGVGAAGYSASASETRATTVTYTHDFTTTPSTSSDNTLSTVKWTPSNASNVGSYNTQNYKGVQLGTSSKTGYLTLTSKYAWGEDSNATGFYGKTKIKKVYLWMNAGAAGSISATVTIGGTSATSDGTSVAKNSSATSQRNGTTKVTYTPATGHDTGVIVIAYSKATANKGAGYICSIQVECEEPSYNVSFNMQGHGSAPSTQSIEAGGKVSEPTAPSVSGYIFGGWYEEPACTNKWNFSTGTISGTKVLYAKWTAKTALTLTADDVNMKLGDSDESVTVTAGGSAVSGYTLTSGNTNVISIVNNQLHVVGLGDATITITKAEDENNTYTSGTFDVHVDYADITSFELDYTEGTLGKGGEATLPGVTILPANANQGYSWGDPVATEGIVYTYDPSTHELAIDANNAVEGTIQFTATATGDSSKKATVVYTVQAAQIAHITSVSASATGAIVAKQYVGNAFNPQGFSFAPTWSEGDHDVVVITANDISWNALEAGSNPTGTYSCADGDFTVTITGVTVVNDTLVSIAFEDGCDMTNKSYYVGDSWDFSGLSIVGTMDSGKTAPAISSSNVTFSSDDAVATDTTSITVTAEYNNLTATKEISGIVVNEVTMDSLTVNYTGGQPVLGTDFTFAGSITANMSNGTHPTVNLSDVTIGSVDKFTTNQQTITVTHKNTGATGTFNVTYKAAQYLGPAPVPANTILFNEPFTGFSKDAKPGTSNSSTTVYGGGSVTYTCTGGGSETKIWAEALAGGTSPELLVGKSGGSFKMAGLPTGSAKVLSFTYAHNNNNNAATCSSSAYTLTGSSGSYTLTLKANTTAPATIDITISNSNSSNTRIDNIQLKITTPADRQVSDEKHAIRIGDVTCSKSPLIAGETISKSDFRIQVQYDTGTALTSNIVPTSVSPTTLAAGTHDYTITYTGSYNDTVTKVIQLTAQEPAVLDSISIVKDSGCDDVFTRNDTFTHNGIHVIAHYTDSTTYPDADVTANADIPAPSNMNVAGTKTINVSYEENGVTKTTSYQITVNPIVSTYLTLSGEGIEGSAGNYTLSSPVSNAVTLSFGKDGDETISASEPASFLSFNDSTNVLTINSSTTTSESGTIKFNAGSASATLTVNVSAAESIELDCNEYISGYVGQSKDVHIVLNNVENATWTLPSSDKFAVNSQKQDNKEFVGTITASSVCQNVPAVFSVLTGKGDTLSVTIYVSGIYDAIESISATTSKTYIAGQSKFNKSDLTVSYVRLSGASGTLDSDKFTLSGEPTGILLAKSYAISVASVENPSATTSCTIEAGVPSGSNVVAKTVTDIQGETVWQKVTDLSTLSTSKQYTLIYENGNSSYMFNNTDDGNAYISKSLNNNECSYAGTDPYLTINYNASTYEASIKCVGGSDALAGKYIYGKSGSNTITSGNSETMMSFEMEGNDNHIVATSNSTSFRFNATAGNTNMRFRFYKTSTTGNAYHYPCLYEKVTKQGTQQISYSNTQQMSASLFNFIFSSYDEENGFKVSWPDMQTEFNKLGSTEKELLQNGVQSGTINNVGTPSCDLFKDFITAYDVEVARLGSTSNFMNRPLLETGSITINYNDGTTSPETFNYPVGNYKLPAPTRAGYVFKGWSVNGSTELKQPNDTVAITKGGSVVITAEWEIAISLTNSAEFKFTGLDMIRFQYVFEGTCPKGVQSGFLVSTSGDADLLLSLTDEEIKAGNNAGVTEVNKADNKLVIGTGDGSKTVSVMFYYIDEDENVEKTGVITMSFDSFVTDDGFDPSIYEDPYAIMALQYYIAGLQDK